MAKLTKIKYPGITNGRLKYQDEQRIQVELPDSEEFLLLPVPMQNVLIDLDKAADDNMMLDWEAASKIAWSHAKSFNMSMLPHVTDPLNVNGYQILIALKIKEYIDLEPAYEEYGYVQSMPLTTTGKPNWKEHRVEIDSKFIEDYL